MAAMGSASRSASPPLWRWSISANRANSPILTLSGGMRQRVSLGCALIHEPELISSTSRTVGIDPELRLTFWTTSLNSISAV